MGVSIRTPKGLGRDHGCHSSPHIASSSTPPSTRSVPLTATPRLPHQSHPIHHLHAIKSRSQPKTLHTHRDSPRTGLCRRRSWPSPTYDIYRLASGYTCHVLVNGREYQTDLSYESDGLAQENAAMRAFMVCRNFSVNGGMLARNGVVQGLPAEGRRGRDKGHRESEVGRRERVNERVPGRVPERVERANERAYGGQGRRDTWGSVGAASSGSSTASSE